MSQTTEQEDKKTETKNAKSKELSPAAWAALGTIIGALISCIGVTITTALNPELVKVISERFLSPSPAPISQTFTVEPVTPTFGPSLNTGATNTQEPITPLPTPYIVGDDWKLNCISTANWQPYLAGKSITESASCYNLVDWGIAAKNGIISINRTEIHNSTALEYGISTYIRGKTKFDISVHINDMEKGEIWLGFLEGDSPKSEGVAVVIQCDDNIDVRSLPTGKEFVDNVHLQYAEKKYETVRVEFNGAQIYIAVNNINIIKRPINITPTRLFLGYRALPNAEINATIYSVEME